MASGGPLPRAAGLLPAEASLLRSVGAPGAPASVAVAPGSGVWAPQLLAHRLSSSAACGIFPDQGANLCPLHWQADSYALDHQGSPIVVFLNLRSRLISLRTLVL